MPRQSLNADDVRITRVEKVHGPYGGLRVRFMLGRTRLSVCVDPEDFTERKLKRAMAREIACEFAFRQAKRTAGKSFPIGEILREYDRGNDVLDLL